MLRLFAFIPLLIVILVLLGASALARGSDALGIAILVAVPVAIAALAWLIGARRRSHCRTSAGARDHRSRSRSPAVSAAN